MNRAGFAETIGLSAEGHKGRFLCAWNPGIHVQPLCLHQHWIHLAISFGSQELVYIIGIYGPPKPHDRDQLWEFLVTMSRSISKPWLLLGDFNQILRPEDKYSSCSNLYKADAFQTTINRCGLLELKSYGLWFTWTNNRNGNDVAWEKLDRVMKNGFPCIRILELLVYL